ncbi:MAG: hypothetical protein HXY40_03315 [Chloroflexi bacterium]|nr:hypothetical protein [Chloroflexota bacterium]
MIKVPEALLERAEAVGLVIGEQNEAIIAFWEVQVRHREAGKRLSDTIAMIDKLPDDAKPSSEEIDAEIRAHQAHKH